MVSGQDGEVCCDAAGHDEGGGDSCGKLVCFMSPECLTHTWYCRGAVRIVAHVSVWRILARRVRDHMVVQRSCQDSGSRVCVANFGEERTGPHGTAEEL